MKKSIYKSLTFIGLIALVSCQKDIDVAGTVFSKHNNPVPNATVHIDVYKESNYPDHSVANATSDQNGNFKISCGNQGKNWSYKLSCSSDSGSVYTDNNLKSGSNTIDIHLK